MPITSNNWTRKIRGTNKRVRCSGILYPIKNSTSIILTSNKSTSFDAIAVKGIISRGKNILVISELLATMLLVAETIALTKNVQGTSATKRKIA